MIALGDVYEVVSESPEDRAETFPRTLEGLRGAIGRAMWLSLAGAPRSVVADGRVIRRYAGGRAC
jgi:hypothetical protein